MKQYLIKIVLFSVVIAISIGFVFTRANGHFDAFYLRFTTPKQSALIIGSSRAAQGLMPSILDRSFKGYNFYNYCFTYNTSPFGPTYLESIKSKFDEQSQNSMFIISVDPWTISGQEANPNDIASFEESELFLGKVTNVNSNPNFNYLINGYTDMYIKMLYNKSPYFLHEDGWLEVNVEKNPRQLEKLSEASIKNYTQKLATYNYSKARLDYLGKTITYLKNHGDVVLVRLPVDVQMQQLENQLIPDFDAKINELSERMSVSYLNLINDGETYLYLDGHHLSKESSIMVTNKVVNFIKSMEAKNRYTNEVE